MRAPWPRPSASAAAYAFTISQKLIALIVLLMLGVVGSLAVYLARTQVQEMEEDLHLKAASFSAVMSKQASSAVAFSDLETAREVLGSFADDEDIAAIRLYAANGDELYAYGDASPWAPKATRATHKQIFSTGARVAAVVPVTSLEGPRGTLVLELSTHGLDAERMQVAVLATATGLIALAVGSLAAWWIARRLARRLRAIAAVATKVADGDLQQKPVDDSSSDEIGTLATAFNKMLAQLRQLIARIQDMAQREKERLEQLVSERTAQLERRNAEMRQIFDQVEQGLLIADLDGTLAENRSAAVERWLGPLPEPATLPAYVRRIAPPLADWFELTWNGLAEDILPIEVALAQLPAKFEVEGRHLELSYKPFRDSAEVTGTTRILIVITDVTAAIARARAERDERESAALMSRVLRDRRSARAFFAELSELMDRLLIPSSEVEFRRTLHTLKGSCAIAELGSLAELAHDLETLADEELAAAYQRASELRARWMSASEHVRELVAESADRLDVRESDVARIEELIRRAPPSREQAELAAHLAGWRDERVLPRFQRFAEHAARVADKLGKAPFEIRVEVDPDLRLSEEKWAPFWAAFLHPLHNAVDHGLIAPRDREAAGRSLVGLVRLCARSEGEQIIIEVHDDGRGVDWSLVAASAGRLGLPTATPAELTEALFHDGMSTRSEVSLSSGRGIGMAALRQVVVESGGAIQLDSSPERGTSLRFTWPRQRPAAPPPPLPPPVPPAPRESSRKIPCLAS